MSKALNELPYDFGGALDYLRKYRKLTNQGLSDLSFLSVEYISKLQNNHIKAPSVQTVIALCIAMSLQFQLSDELLKRSGRSLRSLSTDEDMLYNLMIMSSSDYTVEECNQILLANNLPPLTIKKDSSI